ncbi:hypothetical protein NIES23_22730 [Trichormus variabilis NIES-23]|uniref:Uncharacterized protein n=1 Tax=Trichormus variabilis NIES-23 TaxID=1973479 RepID=A0A1Z4KKI8_ANAVA|nr:hypothetical protein NIES23_22730 [Trichormus variabilis NIES-23]
MHLRKIRGYGLTFNQKFDNRQRMVPVPDSFGNQENLGTFGFIQHERKIYPESSLPWVHQRLNQYLKAVRSQKYQQFHH